MMVHVLQIFSFIERRGPEDFKGTIGYLYNLFTLTVGEWMDGTSRRMQSNCRSGFCKVTFLSIYSDLVVSGLFLKKKNKSYIIPVFNWELSLWSQSHCKLTRPSNRPCFEFLSAGSKPLASRLGSGRSFPFPGSSVAGSLWGHPASPEIPIAT